MADERILFLDIDGVLAPLAFQRGYMLAAKLHGFEADPYALDASKVALLHELVVVEGLWIVVSSSWRGNDGVPEMLRASGLKLPFHEDWRTGHEQPPDLAGFDGTQRGWQCQCWLDRHPGVESYVILDDGNDILPSQAYRFVKPNPEGGLLPEHVEEVKRLLLIPKSQELKSWPI